MEDIFGKKLLEDGIISSSQLKDATDLQESVGGNIEDILLKLNFIDEESLGKFKANAEGLEYSDLKDFKPIPTLMKLLPQKSLTSEQILPMREDGTKVLIAMSHPEHVDIISEIEFKTGKTVKVILASGHQIDKCLNNFFYGTSKEEEEKKTKEVWEYTLNEMLLSAKDPESRKTVLFLKSLTQALIVENRLDRNDLSRFLRINFKLDDLG
ncbi:MAG: hypothetical protein COA79_25120 [Planctomycetota bacterium]|nr:MAG: hypothetical protein COA79_25120 [Planctomycetota bacterium]